MKRSPIMIASLGVLLVSALVFALVNRPSPAPSPGAQKPVMISGLPTAAELVTELTAASTTPESSATSQPIAPLDEQAIVPSIGYLPPPNLNLSGSSLGRQRVPLPAAISDIHQIYYHTPTLALFMSVTEPDGRRSIWKLPEDGKAERVFSASDQTGEIAIFGDSKGIIYVQYDHPSRLYRSGNGL
jgi:hypothetical protein